MGKLKLSYDGITRLAGIFTVLFAWAAFICLLMDLLFWGIVSLLLCALCSFIFYLAGRELSDE